MQRGIWKVPEKQTGMPAIVRADIEYDRIIAVNHRYKARE
jgi:hypothetical protein